MCGGCYLDITTRTRGSSCPFCRQSSSDCIGVIEQFLKARLEKKDVNVILHEVRSGELSDHTVVRHLFRLHQLGCAEGIFLLAEAFYIGKHGLHPNFKRAETYFKEAILLGCADGGAHFHLGCMEFDQDRLWSSFRHLLIAVALGCYDRTLDRKNAALVRLGVRTGMITKAAYEVALRVRQSRLEATRTEGREKFGRCSRLSYNRGLRGNTCVANFTGLQCSRSPETDPGHFLYHRWGLRDEDVNPDGWVEDDHGVDLVSSPHVGRTTRHPDLTNLLGIVY